MISMKIYLIRHGETTGDVENRFGGDYEDHLLVKGKMQVKKLADKLVAKKIEIVYSSPRIRAQETASVISGKLNVPVKVVDNIRERNNYGIMTGMAKTDAKQKYPEESAKIQKSKLHHDVEGSEHYDDFKVRAKAGFDEILGSDKYETIAIISHGGSIGYFFREALKLGEFENLGDCALLEID
ncbi:MAG: histidine phosphatase family protein, partial [Candidatus Heimdallarchaeota archaeon]|nr:histidine phosphatase family protein [Candidatus Heimdallarchaeota archaeon]